MKNCSKRKKQFDNLMRKSLNVAKYNAVKLDEVVEMIKGVLI